MNNDVELIPVKGVLPSVQVQSDNVIYVPQAHKNKAGIVKEGDGVLIENGVVSLNRQTVEDMIDANKWVSYGFEQNLTEDEKGMARHNIGAGDNYFTGSYYDLTQKPHLNTNNTTGLDYGDEELNDTINLHKISKTGSFNDLKHVPQETLDFAESERQKSKNLLNPKLLIQGATVFADGNFTTDTNYVTTSQKINVKPNSQIVMSANIGIDADAGFVFFNDGVYVGYAKGVSTTTVPSNANQVVLDFHATGITPQSITTPQLEYGSVATDYQPYNGQITHNGDAPVVFAEAERQKSKNLFKVNNVAGYSITRNGVTATINDDYTITLNGTCTTNTWWNLFNGIETGSTFSADYPKLYLDINKNYSYVLKQLSGSYSGTGDVVLVAFRQTDGSTAVSGKDVLLLLSDSGHTYINRSGIDYLNNGFFRTTNGITYDNLTFGLMICVGEDRDYQPYNGPIVHEKQLKTREILFDMTNNFIDITSSTLTTLKQYFDLFNSDNTKTYCCFIGTLDNSNFKTLVGNPTGFGNYTFSVIRLVSKGNKLDDFIAYEVIAFDNYSNKIAKGYIWSNVSKNIVFTGWQIIGD